MNLPKDPIMLMCFINTKLRDEFSSFDEFCKAFMVEKTYIEEVLKQAGYCYDENNNCFR